MAINPEDHDTLIDRLLSLFQSNEATIAFGEDPDGWVDENLPEGTEAADVASCLPEVTSRLGGPYQANAGQYNTYHGASGTPATTSVVNEISYTYNTVYQQNAFIYAEAGAQVTNIQGDGNTVTQVQIDQDFGATHPEGWEDHEDPADPDYEDPGHDEDPEDPGYEDPGHDEDPEDPGHDEDPEDPGHDEDPEDPDYEDPMGEDPMGEEPPAEEPPAEEPPAETPPTEAPEDMPEM